MSVFHALSHRDTFCTNVLCLNVPINNLKPFQAELGGKPRRLVYKSAALN